MFITKDTLIGYNPTGEQFSLSLQLASRTTISKLKFLKLATTHAIEHAIHFLSQNFKMDELDFRNSDLQTKDIIKIKETSNITNLRTLNIIDNDITDDAAEFVAQFLSQNYNLEELDLGYNKLKAAGAIKIAEMSSVTTLTKFNISHNNITDDAAESVAHFLSQNCKLEVLCLGYNKLKAAGAIKIAEMSSVTNLKKFDISHNNITDDAAESVAHFLSQNCKLEELCLGYNKLKAAGVIKIAEMSSVTTLTKFNVSHNNITDDAAESIAHFLSQNCKLEELNLAYNELKAAGTIKIAKMSSITSLRKFNISNNSITEDGAESVAHFLSQNFKLEEIDLAHNGLKAAGAIKIAKMSSIVNLKKLYIGGNEITDDAAESLAHFLSQNCKLEELDLTYNELKSTGAIKIAKMSTITSLRKYNISNNSITNDAAKSLAHFLSQNCKLEELDLCCNNLKAAGAIKIAEMSTITSLRKFNISSNSITNDAAESLAHFLSQNCKLEDLDLGNNELKAAGTIKIAEMSTIRSLRKFNISINSIPDNAAESLAHFLSQNCKLEDLDLGYNELKGAGTIKIAEMSTITSLRKFDICNNSITDDAAESLAQFLSQNCKLEELDLGNNKLKSVGAIKIAKMRTITSLRRFDICNNSITNDAAKSLAHFLSRNHKLEELNLGHNKLEAAGAIKIAKLSSITNLRRLNIHGNNITDDAAESVAYFLSQNRKLEEIDLSYNNFKAAGAIKIAELSSIKNLRKLNIHGNSITDDAAISVAHFLSQNCNLEEVFLGYNKLQAAGAIKIIELSNIPNLIFFDISNNNIIDQESHFIVDDYFKSLHGASAELVL